MALNRIAVNHGLCSSDLMRFVWLVCCWARRRSMTSRDRPRRSTARAWLRQCVRHQRQSAPALYPARAYEFAVGHRAGAIGLWRVFQRHTGGKLRGWHDQRAYDSASGHWLGRLSDANGKPIVNPGLWLVTFSGGAGATAMGADPDTLYITAGLLGPTHENAGLFAKISPNRFQTERRVEPARLSVTRGLAVFG
jgi:hypothetical protein